MAKDFKINLGAVDTPYQVGLVEGDGTPANLTDATIIFQMQRIGSTSPKVSAAAAAVDSSHVRYDWLPADVDELGTYTAKWIVTYDDDTVRTYPSDGIDLIEIVTGPNVPYHLMGACAPWTTIHEVRMCCSGLPISGADGYVSDDIIQANINVATDLLFTLSGQQFTGECVEILRPCGNPNCFMLNPAFPNISSWPNPLDPSAYPYESCGCNRTAKIDLGVWPITNVVYVKIDGEVIDPTTYRLDGNRFLVRMDGPGPDYVNEGWPHCQHLDRPGTEVDTFEVMVEFGIPAPDAGRYAVARLACELTKACTGQACQLPGRVSSVNRQQLSFTMINPSMLDNGLTGLYEVDLFIMAYNPSKQRGTTIVWSPDIGSGSYRPGQ